MRPAFVDHNGVPMEKDIPAPSPEVGAAEPTPLEQLCREAAKQAEKASTKGRV